MYLTLYHFGLQLLWKRIDGELVFQFYLHSALTIHIIQKKFYKNKARLYGKPFWLLFFLRVWILDINNYIFTS